MFRTYFSPFLAAITLLFYFACDFPETLNAQNTVPEEVLQTCKAKYPSIKKFEWEIDRNKNYEAKFKLDGHKLRADFSPSGQWIETEESIEWKDLPQAVQKSFLREYKKDRIVELEKTEHYRKGLFYDVEVKPKGKKKRDVEYNAEGQKL